MQMQVPPAPMASYPSFPPVFEPQGPQQQPGQLGAPAPQQQQQQQQQHYYHQSAGQLGADQLGAGQLVQPDDLLYLSLDAFPNITASEAGPSPVLGHFNLTRNPDADLGALDSPYWPAGVDIASNPSFPPPSSVAQEKVLRHLTNPSPCLSVSRQQDNQAICAAPHYTASPHLPFTLHSLLSSRPVLSFALTHSQSPSRRARIWQSAAPRAYILLTVCATRNDKFRRCSSGRSAPCRAPTPRRTNSPTPPTTQMVSSE